MFRMGSIIILALAMVAGIVGSASAQPRSERADLDCVHMSRKKATRVFSHLDGTPTHISEWSVVDSRTLLHVEGIAAKGRVPRDQRIYQEYGFASYFEGWEYETYEDHSFTVECISDPGTKHVSSPKHNCPQGYNWKSKLVSEIGGKYRNWHIPSMGPPYPGSTAIFSKANNLNKPAVYKLPTFIVPFQGIVQDLETGILYTPGYRVPRSNHIRITCY